MCFCVCRCCFCCAPTRLTHTDPCQQEMASAKPSVSASGSPLGNPRHTHTDARTHAHTDKHPSRSSHWLTRRIAPCLTVHPLPGRVRFMSCPGFNFKETACCPILSPPPNPTTGPRSRPQDGAQITLSTPSCLAEVRPGSPVSPVLQPAADNTGSLG